MSAPEMIHTDSSDSFGSEAMSGTDLPSLEQVLDETSYSSATVIIDTEAGPLGGPGLVSEGTGLRAVTPSSESHGDENALFAEGEAPLATSDMSGALIDGISQAESGISAALPPHYRPRGSLNRPTVVYKEKNDPKKQGKNKKEKPEDEPQNPEDNSDPTPPSDSSSPSNPAPPSNSTPTNK